jgi:hypothetical protein
MEIDAIKKGQSSSAGMWMAQVGLWGGIIVTILTTVGGILFLLLSAASSNYLLLKIFSLWRNKINIPVMCRNGHRQPVSNSKFCIIAERL